MSALDQLIAKELSANPSALDALIAREGVPAAAATVSAAPQNSGFLQSGYQALDNITRAHPFLDAMAHHAAQFFDNSAIGVQKGLGAVGDYFDPKRQNPINQQIHTDTTNDQTVLAQREAAYQDRVKGSPIASDAGAVVGSVLPFLVPTNLPAVGGKAAELAAPLTKYLPFQAAANTVIKRGTEGAIIGAGDSQGSGTGTALGAASAVLLPPVVNRLAGSAANAGRYVKALLNPESGAGNAVGNLAQTATPSESSLLAAALKASPEDLSKVTGQPVQNFASADPEDVTSAVSAALQNMSAPQKLAAALRFGAQSPVPGVKYTADQVLAPILKQENGPFVQLNQAFRNSAGGANTFANIEASNNAARTDYLMQFTKSPEELKALMEARRTAAQEAMGTTDELGQYTPGRFNQPVDPTTVLTHIDNLSNGSFGTDKVIKNSLADIKAQILSAADPETGLVTPDIMDGIRQNLNTTIKQNASGGIASTKQQAGLSPLAATINGSIEASNPGFGDYLGKYAQDSIPINTGEAANSLLTGDSGRLVKGSSNVGGDAQIDLPKVNSAIASIDGLEHGVSPEFRQALSNVHQDLQNVSVSNAKMGAVGSPTAYYGNLSGQVGDAINGRVGMFSNPLVKGAATVASGLAGNLTGVPGAELAAGTGMLGSLSAGSNVGGARLQQGYIDMLTDPQKLAAHLANLDDPSISKLGQYLQSLPVIGAAP